VDNSFPGVFPSRASARSRRRCPVARPTTASHGVEPFLSVYRPRMVSPLSVRQTLYAVLTGPEVFPFKIRTSAVKLASNVPTLANLRSPSESHRHLTTIGRADGRSHGVWSLSALAAPEARFTRVCLTRHLPTPGFRTLLPASFFRSLPALFHAGNALRVCLQGFSPPQSLRPLSEPVTFVTLTASSVASRVAPRALRRNRLAFKALLSAKIRHRQLAGLTVFWRPLPSWFFDL